MMNYSHAGNGAEAPEADGVMAGGAKTFMIVQMQRAGGRGPAFVLQATSTAGQRIGAGGLESFGGRPNAVRLRFWAATALSCAS